MMSKPTKPARTSAHYEDPLSRRIGDLKRERAELEEEVMQLRAAVEIWTAVCRHRMAEAAGSEAFISDACASEMS